MRPNQLVKTSSPSCLRSWSFTRCQRSRSVLVILACYFSSKVRVQPSNSGEAGPTMPDMDRRSSRREKGDAEAGGINRSQPLTGGGKSSAAGLGGAGLKCEYKGPTDPGPTNSGQRVARYQFQWLDCRHHAPTSIAPSPMVVTECRAGRFARPSEAACVFHLLHDAHKQVFSLRILDYGDVRAAGSWTQLPPPIFR